MMTTFLYLIRHGETTLNESKVYYGSTDCELNQKGICQVKKLGRAFKDKMDVVISSPLSRAINTAKLVSELPPDEILIDDRLREIDFGMWEGMHYQEVSRKYESEWDEWIKDWKNVAPPNGESFISQYIRVEQSIKEILNKYKGKKVMIVTHQGCLRIISSILLNMEDKAFWNFTFEHGTYSLFEVLDGHLTIRKINCKG